VLLGAARRGARRRQEKKWREKPVFSPVDPARDFGGRTLAQKRAHKQRQRAGRAPISR